MNDITEEIGRIINLLEDAVEEKDWSLVTKMISELDEIYESFEKQDSGFGYDYNE